MKKIFFYLSFIIYAHAFTQIINIPDINFKTKLINANVNNQTAGNTVIDLNSNGEIEQSEALQVTYLFLVASNISDLTGLEYFTNIQYLFVNVNLISQLNISQLTQLITLRCDNNYLTSLNLNGLTSIEQLNINNNNLNSFDCSGLPNLKSISCANNQLSALDLSNNSLLTRLYCSNNNLISINIKNSINHDFSISGFNDCWKTGNPNLATICVDASELTSVQNHLNNCGTAQTINITSNCGLGSDEFVANKVVLYPNPTNSIITISSNEIIKNIELYDSVGRVLVSKIIENNQTSLELSTYSNGIYFIKISTENGEIIEKVVKH